MNKKEQQALDRVLAAGAALSNIAYNIAQHDQIPASLRELCDKWRREWDDARRGYRLRRRPARKQRTT